MLKNIKSSYFIKKFFSHIDEDRKLKIIIYNKYLQNKIDINLINYKIYSGRYIIYDVNKKIREYDNYNDELPFEGEYSNHKRNGKGKEYDSYNDKLIFEGEYLNNKRNGKGKEYYYSGGLKFEGEYKNGKKWNGKGYNMSKELIYLIKDGKGFIKEFNFKGLLIYEGDYLNGKGKEYDYISKKVVYVGEYLDGKRNGKGKEYYLKGNLKFEGEFKNGLKWSGNGYDENNNIIYTLKNGIGYIKKELPEKYDFEGEFLNEKRYKKGKEYTFKGGLKYDGEYFNGQKNGKGKEYYFNGKLKF